MAVLAVLVVAVLAMSYYAEHRKETYGRDAEPCKPVVAVTKGNTVDAPKNANEHLYSPSLIDAFAWPEGATAWFLLFTLFVVAWQSGETRSAAKASKKSAEAAFLQASLTKNQSDLMVEKERAKLRIELHEFRLTKDKHDVYNVEGSVSIYGSTEAYIKKTEIYVSIGPRGILNPLPEWLFGLHLPPVIRAVEQPIQFKAIVMAEDGPAGDEELLPLREASEFIYCMAKIEFSDAFGQKWVYRLRQRFGFFWSEIKSPGIIGIWDNEGQESDNGEYRVETETSKPN